MLDNSGGLFEIIQRLEPVGPQEFLFFHQPVIGTDHVFYQVIKGEFRLPAQFSVGLGCVADQQFDLGRPEVSRIDGHNFLVHQVVQLRLTGGGNHPLFCGAFAFEFNDKAQLIESLPDEFPHRCSNSRGDHKIVGLVVLKDKPHRFDVILGMAPVTL